MRYVHPALAVVLLCFLAGCTPPPDTSLLADKERLERDNQELRRQLESERQDFQTEKRKLGATLDTAKSDFQKLRAELDGLQQEKRQREAQKQELEKKQRAQLESPIVFSDSSNAVEVRVTNILVGKAAVSAEKYHGFKLDHLRTQGKTIIYFEVRITNKAFPEEMNISQHSFSLVDGKNNTYSCEQTRDYITGSIHMGRSITGGIAFAVYRDAMPSNMIYDTGLVRGNSGSKVYATLYGLSRLEVFKKISEE